ncbi:MAG TPA: endoflagellar protein [Eubacteriaceae bacterium]|nr:endoflagellar protein [Eubacteriaceae bacterium]
MILLRSLSGEEFYLNCDLIFKIEKLPDTIITLVDGKKLRVKDSPEAIIEGIVQFQRRIHHETPEVER